MWPVALLANDKMTASTTGISTLFARVWPSVSRASRMIASDRVGAVRRTVPNVVGGQRLVVDGHDRVKV